MRSRFAAIAQRRLALLNEIASERERVAAALQGLAKQAGLVGVGLLASRLLGRSRWFRLAAVGAMAVTAAGPLLARFLSARR